MLVGVDLSKREVIGEQMPAKPLAPKTVEALRHRAKDGGVDLGVAEQGASSLFRVFDAIRELHSAGSSPTRERIVEITGLKPTTVDDRIKALRGEGLISHEKQCYMPLEQFAPAEAISMTVLPSGMYKLEKGYAVMELNPAEARAAGQLLAGKAMEASALERIQELQALVLSQAMQLRESKRHITALATTMRKIRNVDQLFLDV